MFDGGARFAAHGRSERGPNGREIVGMDELEDVAADQLAGAVPERVFGRSVLEEDRSVFVDHRDEVARLFHQCPVEPLTVVEGEFGG